MEYLRKIKQTIWGGGLSSNYDQQKVDFTIGCWKVIDAVQKYTGQHVSLWILDKELLNKRFPNKSDQAPYINGYMTCVQNARKLIHPHLLRIYDIQPESGSFEFTSERVTSCLKAHVGKIDSNDASYIGFQLLDALSFLHNTSKKVHFGVSTSSIFLDDGFNAKLFNFNWLSDLGADNTAKIPFSDYDVTPAFPNIKYTAPEVILAKSAMMQTDIFSFATVFCELLTGKQLIECSTKAEYSTATNPISKIQGMTTNFYQLLSNCLQPSPNLRPLTTDLLKEPAFNTVSVKILRYLDMIVLKDPKDKFEFFKALPKVIGGFSQTLLKCKIIPLLVEECKQNIRFAPILIPTIFQAGKYFPIDEFTTEIFNKIEFLISVLDPPQILIAFLQSLDLIINGTDPSIQEEKVYPIFYSSLKSENAILQKEVLKRLPAVIPKVSLNGVQKNVLPLLLKLCAKTDCITTISSALECIKMCLTKVDHDQFMKYLLPKIYDLWLAKQEPLLVPPLSDILLSLKGSEVSVMSYAFPLGAEIVANSVCHAYYQKQLCSWMLAAVTKYKTANKLDEAVDPQPIEKAEASASALAATELFDPLAEVLNISPAQQNFDFTFSSGQLNSPIGASQMQQGLNFQPQQQRMDFNSPNPSKQTFNSFNSPQKETQNNFNPSFSSPQNAFNPNFETPNFSTPQQTQQTQQTNAPFNPNFESPKSFGFSQQGGFNPQFTPTNNNKTNGNFGSPISKNDFDNLF